MKLVKCRYRVKCEMGTCKQDAEYQLEFEQLGTKDALYFCSDCLKKLHEEISNTFAPKSPPNVFGRQFKAKNGTIVESGTDIGALTSKTDTPAPEETAGKKSAKKAKRTTEKEGV